MQQSVCNSHILYRGFRLSGRWRLAHAVALSVTGSTVFGWNTFYFDENDKPVCKQASCEGGSTKSTSASIQYPSLKVFSRIRVAFAEPQRLDKDDKKPPTSRFFEWYKRIVNSDVRGNYENRLKFSSAPEKVFEYFASIKSEALGGERFMTKYDFLDCILPNIFIPPYENNPPLNDPSGGIGLTGSVFDAADADRDGRISFAEYLLFTTLVSTPKHQFKTAFKVYSSSFSKRSSSLNADPSVTAVDERRLILSKEEFIDMMVTMFRRSATASRHRSTADGCISLPDPRTVSSNKTPRALCTDALQGTLEKVLFTRDTVDGDREQYVSWSAFEDLWDNLENEILYTEFARCGRLEGCGLDASLAAHDFAKMFISFVRPSQMEPLSKRIMRLKFPDTRISFRTLLSFQECIRNLPELTFATEIYSKSNSSTGISPEILTQVLGAVMPTRPPELEELVEILFLVFDLDESGTLEANEFLSIVQPQRFSSSVPESPLFRLLGSKLRYLLLDPFKYN